MLFRRSIHYLFFILSIFINFKALAFDARSLDLRKDELVSPWYVMIEGQIRGPILRISDLDLPANGDRTKSSNATVGFIDADPRPVDVLFWKDGRGLNMKYESKIRTISLTRDGMEQAYEGSIDVKGRHKRVLAVRIENKDIPSLLEKESYYKSNSDSFSFLNPEFIQKFAETKNSRRTSESDKFLKKYNHIFSNCFESDCHIDAFRYYRRKSVRIFFESEMTEDVPPPQFASEKSITDWACHWDNGQYIFDIMDRLYPPSLCKEDVSRVYFETKEIIQYEKEKRRKDEERHAAVVAESKAAQKRSDDAVKKRMAKELDEYKKATDETRRNVKRGDRIAQGLVVKVDSDLVQVQVNNSGSLVWIKRSDILPNRLPPGVQW